MLRLLVGLPPLIVLFVTWDQWPLIPVWDQWFLIPFFEKVADGQATLSDVFARHYFEIHHVVVPRLIFTGLAFASDWTMRLEFWGSFLIVLTTLPVLMWMVSVSFPAERRRARDVTLVLVSGLLFSLVQIWNWAWGFSLMLFLINACVVGGVALLLRAALRRSGLASAVAGAAFACLIATFTMAHGALSFVALAPLVVLAAPEDQRKRFAGLWLLLTVSVWGLFLWGYTGSDSPGVEALVEKVVGHPGLLPGYFLVLLGTPLGWGFGGLDVPWLAVAGSVVCGLGVLVGFLFVGLRLWNRGDERQRVILMAWGSLALFSILYAATNAVGRSLPWFLDLDRLDLARVWFSMYSTPSGLLTIAFVVTVARWLDEIDRPRVFASAAGCLLGVIAINDGFSAELPAMRSRAAQELCFELLVHWDEGNPCTDYAHRRKELDALERIGFRRVRRDLRFIEPAEKSQVAQPAAVLGIEIEDGQTRIRGAVPRQWIGRGGDWQWVLLSRSPGPRFFAFAEFDAARHDHASVPFELRLDGQSAPGTLQAWLYDPKAGVVEAVGGVFGSPASGRPEPRGNAHPPPGPPQER